MTIKYKLFFIGFLVFLGFSAITVMTLNSMHQVQNINELLLQGKDVKNSFIQSTSLTKDLNLTGDLQRTYTEWSDENLTRFLKL